MSDFCSQEVELFCERLHPLHFFNHLGNPYIVSTSPALALFVVLGKTNVGVELRDLVAVLAGSGNLDGTCPVEVEVAKRKGQVLDVKFTKLGFVQCAEEVSGQNTSLSCVSGGEVEVKHSVFGLRTFLLDQFLIDNAS